ncbi:transcriptional regulator, PemK family [hydrothermal vent metagenome]|uniref:Transcriptional regulator, PemK family n=1 Tax=hydrothermal vent metagenome TaxID=652676 RepID=A0A1W1ECK1_9ZZZZ
MDYKRGDIVLVNFNPQKKAEEVAKIRPAIIMSDSQLNEVLDLVTVVALTTNLIDDAEPLRLRIKAREKLKKDSDAMIEQIRSVSKQRIREKIASLHEDELEKIAYGIREMLVL